MALLPECAQSSGICGPPLDTYIAISCQLRERSNIRSDRNVSYLSLPFAFELLMPFRPSVIPTLFSARAFRALHRRVAIDRGVCALSGVSIFFFFLFLFFFSLSLAPYRFLFFLYYRIG